jgi:glycosidase
MCTYADSLWPFACCKARDAFIVIWVVLMIMGTAKEVVHAQPVESPVQVIVPSWVRHAVFYQIFPERFANGDPSNDPPGTEPWGGVPKSKNYFGGDLQGIIDHLDYIASLGVNALYLNPIFESNSNHKYHATDFLKIDPQFGDERVFKRLVDECHARGIRVILDGVFNHTGVHFFAFEDIKKHGALSRYVKWYNIHSFPVGPASKPNYECWWGYGDLPKLMTHNPEVRDYLFKVTRHWMGFGIDGWRLDVPNEIPHPFWIEWRRLVKSINPEAYIVGEIWDDARSWLQGDQFDAVMNYRFRKACLDFFVHRRTSSDDFAAALDSTTAGYPRAVNFAMQNLLGSHDTERLLTLCEGNKGVMKLAWVFQLTYPGAPMVYYGDEIGMMGGKDPGCRGTMIWDEEQQDPDLREYMRSLVALRNRFPVFRQGSFEAKAHYEWPDVFSFVRRDGETVAFVVLNNGVKERAVTAPAGDSDSLLTWRQVWPEGEVHNTRGGDERTAVIPGYSGKVFIGEKR